MAYWLRLIFFVWNLGQREILIIVEMSGINLRVLIPLIDIWDSKLKIQLFQQGFLDHLAEGKVLYTIVSELQINLDLSNSRY